MKLILSCEHAGNEVPLEYQHLFSGAEGELHSHRGYDPGALDLFNELKPLTGAHFHHKVSRLLVETNRSLHHPNLFSEFSKQLSREEKKKVLAQFYFPYRKEIEKSVSKAILKGEQVLHISVHSFTPILNGEVRRTDIGFLYDPSRKPEKEFSALWKRKLQEQDKNLKLRFNYPYLGTADGLTSYLRKKFPDKYLGIELEVNQKFSNEDEMETILKKAIFDALSEAIQKFERH